MVLSLYLYEFIVYIRMAIQEKHFCLIQVQIQIVFANKVIRFTKHSLHKQSFSIFGNDFFLFQQDSGPAHKAERTQEEWLNDNVSDFITSLLTRSKSIR